MPFVQTLQGGTGNNGPGGGATQYWRITAENTGGESDENHVVGVAAVAGTFKNMQVMPRRTSNFDPGSGTDTYTVALRTDGGGGFGSMADSSLAITWDGDPAPAEPQEVTADVTVAVGDLITIGISRSASAAFASFDWDFTFEPSTAKTSAHFGTPFVDANTTGARHTSFGGNSGMSTTNNRARAYMQLEGAWTALYVGVETDPSPGNWDVEIFVNGFTQATANIASGSVAGSWTGTVTITKGDYVAIQWTPNAGAVGGRGWWGAGFTADTDGEWPLWADSFGGVVSNTVEAWNTAAGTPGYRTSAQDRIEVSMRADQNMHFLDWTAYAEFDPNNGGASRLIEIEEDAVAVSGQSVTINDGSTSAEETDEYTPTAGAYLSFAQTPSGTPTAGRLWIGVRVGDTATLAGGFNAQRAAIIAGITFPSSPATGWNNLVRDGSLQPSDVVRTGPKVVTITLPPTAGYSIGVDETGGEATIPAASMKASDVDVVATPTFDVLATAYVSALMAARRTDPEPPPPEVVAY